MTAEKNKILQTTRNGVGYNHVSIHVSRRVSAPLEPVGAPVRRVVRSGAARSVARRGDGETTRWGDDEMGRRRGARRRDGEPKLMCFKDKRK
jgi:hypothetical protein